MIWFLFIIWQGVLGRLAGNGFGKQWGVSWLPEALFAVPFGLAFAYAISLWLGGLWTVAAFLGAAAWSYAFMQSGTWMFLRWESHEDPNTQRSSTLKPIIDWLAEKFGYSLGDEGYAWTAAAVKGFLIGLPVGGIPLAILWPLGYELGSHAKGRVERFGVDPHLVAEAGAGAGGGIAIVMFLSLLN